MKASELRIGNLIEDGSLHRTDHEKVVICEILADCVTIDDGTLEYKQRLFDDISGIPLTAEWLERFGFPKRLDGSYLQEITDSTDFNMRVHLRQERFVWISSKFGPTVELKYVHQLQNLYFALTGTELTLTP